ncbi:MAG TPA: ectonucleotide pyrophosphatase/phosphodiesterase [Caulobacteraceae bacterium]|nr:ectonucleotide pyrophosphatase/phosphodiesterase [Caulobacteraceae bacterium]
MRRSTLAQVVSLAFACIVAGAAQAAPVLMISVDGLRPGDVLEADQRGVTAPYLTGMAKRGLYATGVRNALPTVTYPNHTTLVTGVWPARHGIEANVVFDPLRKSYEAWYWYSPMIRVPTLWDAVHAQHRLTASLGWPVTVDNPSIDENLPEYWRARIPGDADLLHALSTPGLPELVAPTGFKLMDVVVTEPAEDEAKAKAAAAIYAAKRPYFMTLHLSSLDHFEHLYAPGSPQAYGALQRIDAAIAGLVAAARQAEPDLVVVLVSDHGFAPISHEVSLPLAFVEAGLITLNARGEVESWQAMPWVSGGSAAVVLAQPGDEAVRAKTAALLRKLSNDPNSGLGRVMDRAQIAAAGGAPDADFFVDAKPGYEIGSALTGPLISDSVNKGTHGYFPDNPAMRATLIIDGAGQSGSLGEVDMRDIAPTVAQILNVSLPSAEGKSLLKR